jgi:hypothetical protein
MKVKIHFDDVEFSNITLMGSKYGLNFYDFIGEALTRGIDDLNLNINKMMVEGWSAADPESDKKTKVSMAKWVLDSKNIPKYHPK